MKNTFKKGIASVMAIATLMTGMTGIVSNAAEVNSNDTAISIDEPNTRSGKSFSFTNVGTGGAYCSGTITLTSAKTITISFGHCSVGSALVSIRSASDDTAYDSFVIPASAGTTLYFYTYLPAGSYRFYVTPYGCSSTSGGFYVTY